MNETLLTALAVIPGLVIAIVFHEVAHGWVALALGDPTAKEQRRLSLNPIRHVDAFGTLILPGLLFLSGLPTFGWAKPVPVVAGRLRNPRFGMMAVAAAGPLTNFILATLGALVFGLYAGGLAEPLTTVQQVTAAALQGFILINIFLGLFNLLPVPPFDGSHIVEGLLPEKAARAYASVRRFSFPLLILLLVVIPWLFPEAGIVQRFVMPPFAWAADRFLGIADWAADL